MKHLSKNRFVWLIAGVGIGAGICLIFCDGQTCPLELNYLRIRHEAVSRLAGAMWAEADYAKDADTIPNEWVVGVSVEEDDLDENSIIADAYNENMRRLRADRGLVEGLNSAEE
jgi:hypothetical protein